jgi:hypothetical protein
VARILAITDSHGKLLGVQRADPVDIGDGRTIQAVPHPHSPDRYHRLDVPDHMMGKPGRGVEELHKEVRRLLAK